ncbi:MAG: hypothetical protein IPL29_02655 [Propionivibrio sp.]|nr:hypothetical protein [Propionivibrio sp.]
MSLFMESIHAKITYDAEQALIHARRNKPLIDEAEALQKILVDHGCRHAQPDWLRYGGAIFYDHSHDGTMARAIESAGLKIASGNLRARQPGLRHQCQPAARRLCLPHLDTPAGRRARSAASRRCALPPAPEEGGRHEALLRFLQRACAWYVLRSLERQYHDQTNLLGRIMQRRHLPCRHQRDWAATRRAGRSARHYHRLRSATPRREMLA